LTEQETLYLPPELKDGALISGVMVSEGTLVDPEETVTPSEEPLVVPQEVVKTEDTTGLNSSVNSEREEIEDSLRENEKVLGDEEKPSVLVEGEGVSLGGSTDSEGIQDISVEGISNDVPRTELAKP